MDVEVDWWLAGRVVAAWKKGYTYCSLTPLLNISLRKRRPYINAREELLFLCTAGPFHHLLRLSQCPLLVPLSMIESMCPVR